MAPIEMLLTPQGVIAGRVLDREGEPMERVQVQLLRSRYVNGKKLLSATKTASTNDLGEYRFAGLTPGRYYIYAADLNGSAPPSSVVTEEYVPAYFPNATDSAGAMPLEVAAGTQVRADMVLRKERTVTVKGRVVVEVAGTSGAPAVRVSRWNGHDEATVSTWRHVAGMVKATGEFEIRSVAPGTYGAMAEIAKGNRQHVGVTSIVVGSSNVDGLVITIPNPVTLTGRIRVEGDTEADLAKAEIRLQRGGRDETVRVAADGSFRAEELDPGRYSVVAAGLPDGFYTKRVHVGGVDVTHTKLEAGSGPVDILVSPKAGVVVGVARNGKKAAAGATVVLVPDDKTRVHPQVLADPQGRFKFKNVVPGDYRVYAWEDVEATAWLDPDFMRPLAEKGQPVKVAESAEVDVSVNPDQAEADRPKQ